MEKIRVGVLRGGPSNEHEVSLKTGENVLNFLPREKYRGIDIILKKNCELFADGQPIKISYFHSAVDVVFNALHGYFGEDGKIQQILDSAGLLYTGSGPLSSALGMNKILSRDIFQRAGLKIPRAIIAKNEEPAHEAALRVFRSISPSWIVKPASGGSSIGVAVVDSFSALEDAIKDAFNYDSSVIVEEYVRGREVTCGILENFRKEEYYALPAIEIVPPPKKDLFDYECKYDGSTKEICPAPFDVSVKKEIEEIARSAHRILECSGYSRADMIVSPRDIYLLELNTLPGLTSESLVPKAAKAVGLEFPQLLEHIIDLALNKKTTGL
jgi:D-alanine--D-alanine ligase